MEQKNLGEMAEENINATSEKHKKSVYVEILNDLSVRLFILVFVLVVGYFGYSYIQKKNECLDSISYHPAGSKANDCIGAGCFGRDTSYTIEESYYSYRFENLETKKDAVSYCMRNREDWLWKL